MTADTDQTLRAENADLRARLDEAEEILRAIRVGEVDTLVVDSATGPQIFTLQGLDADVNRFRGEILAQVSDAVVAVDNLQRVTYLNAAAEQMYGVSASEVLGCHLSGIHESIWQHLDDEVRAAAALRETGRWYGESVHRRRDGSTIHVESSVSMLHNVTDGTGSGQLSVIRDITERRRTEDLLQASLEEKVVLLKEIHHRVKNNLQIVSSLLNLQSVRIEDPITKTVLLDMQHRIRSMALVHENLYRSDNLAALDLATYLNSLCTRLYRSLVTSPSSIRLQMNLAPVRLNIDKVIPCGLLVNELITNALKHAFPDGRSGELRVELQELADGRGCRLRVADNGVGLPPDFDLKQAPSLGLKLVADLARQLGGQLEIGTGPGAVFEIEFTANPESQ
jgi:PAS domain S-box-containing protein